MEQRALGESGIEVSLICLGTMTWGHQNSEQEAHAQMDYAAAQGVNFFDTAEVYPSPMEPGPEGEQRMGSTERYIGSWFKQSGKRNDIVLATKVSGPAPFPTLRPDMQIDGRVRVDEKNIMRAVEDSLTRLQTDWIDLYQIHWPTRRSNFFGRLGYDGSDEDGDFDRFADIIAAMDKLKQQGKIRAYGLSNESPYGMMEYLRHAERLGLPAPVSIQNPYSLVNRTFEVGLSEMTLRCNIACLPYSPLASGMLSGKYLGGAKPEGARMTRFPGFYSRYIGAPTAQAIEKYVALAKTHGLDPAQMALAFVNSRKFVTSNIIGATNLDQLNSNIASAALTLSDEIIASLEAIHSENSNPAP